MKLFKRAYDPSAHMDEINEFHGIRVGEWNVYMCV